MYVYIHTYTSDAGDILAMLNKGSMGANSLNGASQVQGGSLAQNIGRGNGLQQLGELFLHNLAVCMRDWICMH